jgi:hypothetical protein
MDVDAFLESVASANMRLSVPSADTTPGGAPDAMDALFHLPLLALATMIIARRMPFRTVTLGRSVTMLLVEHFTALRHSPHGLETSLTLRRRCADALAFLEAAGLAMISPDRQRVITLTQGGKNHIDRAARDATDLGLLVRQLRTNQERIMVRIGDER